MIETEPYPWQRALWSSLATRTQHAHAYLFHGPQGIGKRHLVEQLARLLLCQAPQEQQACGRCKACLLLAAGTHPDYALLVPEEPDKPIRVDQVRELMEFIGRTAQQGGAKVVLIDPAEAMNLNAANALLKSLEEPSGDTRLLLISHQPSRLLATIRSRCVQQPCPVPSTAMAQGWLNQRLPDLNVADSQRLLHLAADAPLTALKLHEQGVLLWRSQVVDDLKKLHQGQQWPSALAEAWNALPLLLLLDWFYEWTLLMVRYQMTADPQTLAQSEWPEELHRLAQHSTSRQVLALQDWLLLQRQKVQSRANLNRQLLLEALLVQWSSLLATG